MRANNTNNWEYDPSINTLLFFAQRMDELLFHHSTDSYRYPVLSIEGISDEYIRIYDDAQKDIISNKNLKHIMEEFLTRLKEDTVAISILTKEYKERFENGVGSWSDREKYENMLFVSRKLGGRKYYDGVVNLLRNCIHQNKEKRLVDRYAGILIRVLIDEGYNETYIFSCVHDVFFHKPVKNADSYEDFIKRFSFKNNQYDVYIGFSIELSTLLPLFKRIEAGRITITKVEKKEVPTGIKAKGQKTILKFENVFGLDVYSTYEMVKGITDIIINAYAYYSHIKNVIKVYGQIVDKDGKITSVSEHDLLKHRVSAMSHEESTNNAERMLKIAFSTFLNIREISKVTEIHNDAVYSNNTSDSLLALWSIAESMSGNENGDKITKVKECMIPFLKSTYIEKIVRTCMMDIKRWDSSFFEEAILRTNPQKDELEATFAFLVLDDQEEQRKLLYSRTELFPLLRYRVYFLNAQLKNTKGYMAMLKAHEKRVEWQLHRIYRARNYVIHDGRRIDGANQELVINLHSYIDTMFSKVIELLMKSPYQGDSIEDTVIEHKLKTAIMDEKCEHLSKANIEEHELKAFLFYDFEMT